MIEVRGLSKRFGAHTAPRYVDLDVARGEVDSPATDRARDFPAKVLSH